MNIYEFGPVAAALDGASSVVQLLTDLVTPLAGLDAAALAVVLLTLLVRVLLVPVGVSQARAQRTRRRLAPRIAELRRRFARDPQRLQRETMALYAEEKASPLAGCVPLLLQAPVLSLVYGLFVLPTIGGSANPLFGEALAGASLGSSLAAAVHGGALGTGGALGAGVVVGGVVLVVLAGVLLLSRWMTMRQAGADVPLPGGGGRVLSWLPLVTVVVAVFVPLAATLYLTTSAVWTLAERSILGVLIQ